VAVLMLAVLAGAPACGEDPSSPAEGPPYALVGGRWFNGTGFTEETVYVVDSVLTRTQPAEVGETIDLAGGWVIPPVAESHTHTITSVPSRIDLFLELGVFYAGVMNAYASEWATVESMFGGPESVDIRVALAGFTASDGHPLQIGLRSGRTAEELDGDWLNLVDSEADVDARWDAFLATGTEAVKVFLVNSEEYAERHGNPDIDTRYRGLDPTLLPGIVERAHAAGLPVVVHVRTAADYRTAVAAGVDEIGHTPGFSMGPGTLEELEDSALLAELDDPDRFTITAEDAAATAAAGVAVHTTLLGIEEVPSGLPADVEEVVEKAIAVSREVQTTNVTRLLDAGVPMLIGSDAGEETVVDEIGYLERLGPFTPLELLVAAAVTSPRALFPGRSIGRLEDGYEASFLVLGSDPGVSLAAALADIRYSMKEGHWLK
jgi:imidazolonepropionase-like amidohydrolase